MRILQFRWLARILARAIRLPIMARHGRAPRITTSNVWEPGVYGWEGRGAHKLIIGRFLLLLYNVGGRRERQ